MVMRSENWPDDLEPGLAEMYQDEYNLIPAKRFDFYKEEKATTSYDKRSGAGALGAVVAHNGTVEYDDFEQKYDKQTNFTAFSKGIQVTREMADDDLYHVFDNLAKSLGFAMAYRQEEDAASVLNEHSTTTPSDGDGVVLSSLVHPSNVAGVSTQSNRGTSSASPTSVAAARLAMRGFRNDRGQRIHCMGDTIAVPPELEQTMWEIIKTPGKVDSADNNLNFLQGRYKLITWDFLTDANDWFMMSSHYMKMFLIWFTRIATEFGQDKDSDTFNAKYYSYMRYGYNWYDWIWIYCNLVS